MEVNEHLEQAEHAQHAAHAPFDRRVAVTMAIVAAVLAGVAMVSHRTHNQTLLYHTEAGNKKVEASNLWAQYQAKRLRQSGNKNTIDLLTLLTGDSSKEKERKAAMAALEKKNVEYGDEKSGELSIIFKDAKATEAASKEAEMKSHHSHAQADYLDLAHLAVEMGLVLCSLSLLTKRSSFWLSGIISTAIGILLVTWGLLLPPHEHAEFKHEESIAESKPH